MAENRRSNMSVLAYTPDFADRRAARTLHQPGPFRRLLRGILESRRRRAEQDIAFHLGLSGGHITDEIERRMNERLFSGAGFRA
jgi:hypothetical protein